MNIIGDIATVVVLIVTFALLGGAVMNLTTSIIGIVAYPYAPVPEDYWLE